MRNWKYIVQFFLKKILFIFRGERREKEKESNIIVRLPFVRPLLGTWPTAQAGALTGNQTSDFLVCRLAFNTLSHTSQGILYSSYTVQEAI